MSLYLFQKQILFFIQWIKGFQILSSFFSSLILKKNYILLSEIEPLWYPLLFNVRSMKLYELVVNTFNCLFYVVLNIVLKLVYIISLQFNCFSYHSILALTLIFIKNLVRAIKIILHILGVVKAYKSITKRYTKQY